MECSNVSMECSNLLECFFDDAAALAVDSSSGSSYCRAAQEQRSRGSSSRWRLFFEERLPTNDGWFEYEGVVDMKTGTHITGTFKWSMLAGKDRGTFGMTVVEKEETAGAEE